MVKLIFSFVTALFGFLLFVRFPDLDIKLLGIGAHRNFLFHSAILPALGYFLIRKSDLRNIVVFSVCAFCSGMSFALGIHLLSDTFQKTAVKFPFIGSLVDGTSIDDRLWLGFNSLLCLLVTYRIGKRVYKEIRKNS
jgi:hypothetical protein